MARKPDDPDAALVPDLEPVIDILRDATGFDLTHYKPNMLYRRIVHRMALHELGGLVEYVKLLASRPAEARALHRDILVNVTSFFRDPEEYEALKDEVFPALARARAEHEPLRVWTPGCSTGEEAYSIAMAVAEYAHSSHARIPVEIFATDIDAGSLERARRAIYPASAVADLPPARVRRFFVEAHGGYRVADAIRDACAFVQHNALEEPPPHPFDLVTCRNLLIYLEPDSQAKLIRSLHGALRPDGYLWLGPAETAGAWRDLFEAVDVRFRLFRRKLHILGQPATTDTAMEALRSANAELERVNAALEASAARVDSCNAALAAANEELQRGCVELERTHVRNRES